MMKPHRLPIGVVFLLPLLWSCASLRLFAQSENIQSFTLDNGVRVLYQVQTEVSSIDSGLNQSYQNTIERTLRDQNRAWLGFEIHIDRVGRGDLLRISMEPVSGWPFFAEHPIPREIHSGDRVILDVMEQPSTGLKIFDTFQVGLADTPMQALPSGSHAIAQIPRQSLAMQFNRPRFKTDRGPIFAHNRVSGNKIAVTVPAIGRFIFTSQPESGFHMEAVAQDMALEFLAGANRYRIDCEGPILDQPGAWYLWVKFEPAAPPTPAGSIKFKEKELTLEVIGEKSNAR